MGSCKSDDKRQFRKQQLLKAFCCTRAKQKFLKWLISDKNSSLQLLGKIKCNSGEAFVPKTVQISWSKRHYSASTGGRFIRSFEDGKTKLSAFLLHSSCCRPWGGGGNVREASQEVVKYLLVSHEGNNSYMTMLNQRWCWYNKKIWSSRALEEETITNRHWATTVSTDDCIHTVVAWTNYIKLDRVD